MLLVDGRPHHLSVDKTELVSWATRISARRSGQALGGLLSRRRACRRVPEQDVDLSRDRSEQPTAGLERIWCAAGPSTLAALRFSSVAGDGRRRGCAERHRPCDRADSHRFTGRHAPDRGVLEEARDGARRPRHYRSRAACPRHPCLEAGLVGFRSFDTAIRLRLGPRRGRRSNFEESPAEGGALQRKSALVSPPLPGSGRRNPSSPGGRERPGRNPAAGSGSRGNRRAPTRRRSAAQSGPRPTV